MSALRSRHCELFDLFLINVIFRRLQVISRAHTFYFSQSLVSILYRKSYRCSTCKCKNNNNACSLQSEVFFLFFSRWKQGQLNEDTSKAFLMKKMAYLQRMVSSEGAGRREGFSLVCCFYCLITTWHSWCELYENAGLWIFTRRLQNQLQKAINNLPKWLPHRKTRTLYCVLNILYNDLYCAKEYGCVVKPSNPCLFFVVYVCSICVYLELRQTLLKQSWFECKKNVTFWK